MNTIDNTIKTTNQNIRQIAIADMEPESGYQRATNPALVENIVMKFDETRLGTLIVSAREGKYHIIDGAHRSKALRRLGYTHAPCVVLTGLTFRQEAEYFRSQNEEKRLVKPIEFFKAGLVSGDEQCASIYKLIKSNGFRIGSGKKDFYRIAAIKALLTITDEYGYDVLDATLGLIASAWNGFRKASQSESLLGVAEFVSRYGTADFAGRMKGKFNGIFRDYTEVARTRASTGSLEARKKFCRVIVDHYNGGLTADTGRRLKWEG